MADVQRDEARSNIRTQADTKAERSTMRRFGRNVRSLLREAWIDLLLLVVLSVACAGVWIAPHAFTKVFPVTFYNSTGDIVSPEYAYPYTSPPLNTAGAGLFCGLVPVFVILLFQIKLQSFTDAVNALMGLGYALIVGTLFQVTLKKTIGGLRPHFLSVCEPELPVNPSAVGTGYQNLMFTIEQVCRGDPAKIKNAMESFPSGHSQIAFAGLGYLAIYLFTHLRVQAHEQRQGPGARRGRVGMGMWRMPIIVAPVLLATYISSTLVLTYNHHWYDVLVGGAIGSVMALFAYRMVFEGVVDEKGNLMPRWKILDDEEGENDGSRTIANRYTDEDEAEAALPR